DIEAVVAEWQIFGIRDLELDGVALGVGAQPRAVEQRRNVVGRGHSGETPRRRERGVAVSGRDIEHAFARAHIRSLAQGLADDLQGCADYRVIARAPGGLLLRLDGRKIGSARGLGGRRKHHEGVSIAAWWARNRGAGRRPVSWGRTTELRGGRA